MRLPGKLTGTSSLVPWLNALRDAIACVEIKSGLGYRVRQSSDGTVLDVDAGASGGAFKWQSPKELDPSVSVSKDTFVYITSGNDLVTAGMTDAVSAVNAKSIPGIWQAAQDVPAASGGSYNVPVWPYPGATGIVTGSPAKGDLDTESSGVPTVFWILICPDPCS